MISIFIAVATFPIRALTVTPVSRLTPTATMSPTIFPFALTLTVTLGELIEVAAHWRDHDAGMHVEGVLLEFHAHWRSARWLKHWWLVGDHLLDSWRQLRTTWADVLDDGRTTS